MFEPKSWTRALALTLLLALVGLPAFAGPAPKVDVCHVTGSGVFIINVSSNALGGHLGHGDFLPLTFYADADGDGYGDAATSVVACEAPAGFVEDGTDCDDTDAAVHPGAEEVPGDGIDNDCNPDTPDELTCVCAETDPLIAAILNGDYPSTNYCYFDNDYFEVVVGISYVWVGFGYCSGANFQQVSYEESTTCAILLNEVAVELGWSCYY